MKPPRLDPPPAGPPATSPRRIALDAGLLLVLVLLTFFLRIGDLPPMGEEGRRARGAINMIESGDWIVVRQGGVVFPDRPPMTNWLIAVSGLVRGAVDTVAMRAPSVSAVLATVLLLYLYCARLDSRVTALTAAASYATFGQVMQIGRLGESESVFAFFMAAALLLWHMGFALRWRPVLVWSLGYSFAGLAALVKGLQAPVYFVAATGAYLLLQRRWKWLFGWGQWVGAACFLLIVAAWQVPYYLRTDLQASMDTWFAVVGPRLGLSGLLENIVSYPLETIGCLLPWSLVLAVLLHRGVRRRLLEEHPQIGFVLVALIVTYPTVWFSAGAKGRYYIPLYPCVAVVIGSLVDTLSRAPEDSFAGRIWRLVNRAAILFAVFAVGALAFIQFGGEARFDHFRQTLLWSAFIVAVAAASVVASRRAMAHRDPWTAGRAVLAAAALLGTLHMTFWVDSLLNLRVDLRPTVSALRDRLPSAEKLVSLGPIDPRFAYAYRHLIREIPLPTTAEDFPPDVEYFCFDWRPTDTLEERHVRRGMKSWSTPGTLPFAWEEIERVQIRARPGRPPKVAVVVARILRTPGGEPAPPEESPALAD